MVDDKVDDKKSAVAEEPQPLELRRRLGDWTSKGLMYTILSIYAIIAMVPFASMVGTSLMTQLEATSGTTLRDRFLPKDIRYGTDISPCILVTRDTYFDARLREEVTTTRVVIDISQAVSQAQGYGFRATGPTNLQREELLRIPFLSNYCAAWQGASLGRYMWNTVLITGITVVGMLIVTILAAYAFARLEFIGRELIFAIMLSTLMIPGIVTNLPNLLILVGIERWMETTIICREAERCLISNWPALTIPFMAQAINIFLMRQHFASIPEELWDAARIDGAGHIRFLVQVIIPLSKPVILVVVLFTFISAWNELAWALLVTPGDDTWRPIAVGLQRFLDDEGPLPHLRMAGALITILPVLLLYALTQRQFIEGLSQSGLKG